MFCLVFKWTKYEVLTPCSHDSDPSPKLDFFLFVILGKLNTCIWEIVE